MTDKSIGHIAYIRNWEFYKIGTNLLAHKRGLIDPITGYPDPKYSHKVCNMNEWAELKPIIESGRYYG